MSNQKIAPRWANLGHPIPASQAQIQPVAAKKGVYLAGMGWDDRLTPKPAKTCNEVMVTCYPHYRVKPPKIGANTGAIISIIAPILIIPAGRPLLEEAQKSSYAVLVHQSSIFALNSAVAGAVCPGLVARSVQIYYVFKGSSMVHLLPMRPSEWLSQAERR